jgi:hypothetical protein
VIEGSKQAADIRDKLSIELSALQHVSEPDHPEEPVDGRWTPPPSHAAASPEGWPSRQGMVPFCEQAR